MSRPHLTTPAQQLQDQLEDTGRALAAAQAGYDPCADGDLLEYYLYEISALRAKYTYLLRQSKRCAEDPTMEA